MIVEVSGCRSAGGAGGRPVLDQAVPMSDDYLGMAPARTRAIAAWVNTDPRARMLLSRSGRIHWANTAAYRMLRHGRCGLRAPNDVVVADNEEAAAILARLLREAPMDAAVHAVTPADIDHQWVLWAQQLIPGGDVVIGFGGHRIADPVCYDAMLKIHHLTPSETRIIKMMLAGMETGRIAQKRDISIETLRTHIKHAYRKLEVKSRGELFAKAVHFTGP